MITTSGIAYSVYLSDPTGARLADASNFVRLNYVRTVNDYGTLTLTLPGGFDTRLIRVPDGIVEVFRRIPGTNREILETETFWLIQRVEYARNASGLVSIVVEADTPLGILRDPGRYQQSTINDVLTDTSDNLCVDLVNLTVGTSAEASIGRRIPNLTVQPYQSSGPELTISTIWQAPLDLMQEIANSSAGEGTYLAFDFVATAVPAMEFRTFTGQRGVDRRAQVILSPERGNLAETSLSINHRDEVTIAAAYGQGNFVARLSETVSDKVRINASPYRYRETFVNYNKKADIFTLADIARAAVRAGRPQIIFSGKIVDTEDTRYGVHWGWGDFVTAQDFGQSFDARVDAISVTVEATSDGPAETIGAYIRADDGSLVTELT